MQKQRTWFSPRRRSTPLAALGRIRTQGVMLPGRGTSSPGRQRILLLCLSLCSGSIVASLLELPPPFCCCTLCIREGVLHFAGLPNEVGLAGVEVVVGQPPDCLFLGSRGGYLPEEGEVSSTEVLVEGGEHS